MKKAFIILTLLAAALIVVPLVGALALAVWAKLLQHPGGSLATGGVLCGAALVVLARIGYRKLFEEDAEREW